MTCSDNSEEKFDHVIFTGSLGVLKQQYKSMFDPPLPFSKQNSIDGISFGAVDKIFLKFSSRWWPKDCKGFNFVWRDEELLSIKNEFPEGPSLVGIITDNARIEK